MAVRKASRFFPSNDSDSAPSRVKAQHTTQGIPNNGDPSPSPPKGIQRKILAFRTITKLLSQIQQEREFQVSKTNSSPQDRDQLLLSNAFATIAVINREVVAVVTERTPEKLKIIACASKTSIDDDPHINKDPAPQSPLRRLQLFIQNYRRDAGLSKDLQLPILTGELTISDSGILAGVDLIDDEMVKQWADDFWSNSTIARHLLILSRLLSMQEPSVGSLKSKRDPSSLSTRLLRYVIATCYPKIHRRLKNTTVSMPYIQSLKEVGAFEFTQSKLDEASAAETENDRLFLHKFLSKHAPPIDIPKLLEQANAVVLGKAFQLYTEDTCGEFHKLLIELLDRFETSLQQLAGSRGSEKDPTKASEEFKKNVSLVMQYGYALQRLARGAALRMHLQTIAPLMELNLHPGMSTPMPALGEEQQHEEPDEDLQAVQPFANVNGSVEKRLWRSYLDWLRLIMSHFDAVEILVGYVTGPNFPHDAISIQSLVAPSVDRRLLPWRELFTDSKLFPIQAPPSAPDYYYISNASILEFLNNALHNANDSYSVANAIKKQWNDGNLQSTIENLEKFKSSKLPGWEIASRLLVNLEGLQAMPVPNSNLHCELSKDILSISQNSKFFTSLASLNPTEDFGGTLHCEAYLVSLLDDTAAVNENILAQMEQFGSTIGISKRCCPTCVYLLYLLAIRRGQPFTFSGSHNTVTACTLPTWLPENIIDSMNDYFGAQLRQKLVELVVRSKVGSQRLSYDSE